MICAAIGEGVVAFFTGKLMDLFGIDMLFYSLFGYNFILLLALLVTIYLLKSVKS